MKTDMAPKKRKILCKKCTEMKNQTGKRYKAKETRNQRSKVSSSQGSRQRKRTGPYWRSSSVQRQSQSRIASHHGLFKPRTRRLREESPDCYQSAYEADDYIRVPVSRMSPLTEVGVPRSGILKRRISSADLVSSYLNTGMEKVASFIVESALRFGKKHGVVVPEKGRTGVYQITSPKMLDDRKRSKKIRFKIPEGTLGYEDAKKAMWRSRNAEGSDCAREEVHSRKEPGRCPAVYPSGSVTQRSQTDESLTEGETNLKSAERKRPRRPRKREKSAVRKKTKAEEEQEARRACPGGSRDEEAPADGEKFDVVEVCEDSDHWNDDGHRSS